MKRFKRDYVFESDQKTKFELRSNLALDFKAISNLISFVNHVKVVTTPTNYENALLLLDILDFFDVNVHLIH